MRITSSRHLLKLKRDNSEKKIGNDITVYTKIFIKQYCDYFKMIKIGNNIDVVQR